MARFDGKLETLWDYLDDDELDDRSEEFILTVGQWEKEKI